MADVRSHLEVPTQETQVHARLDAIVVGGLVCLVVQLVLMLLGSAVGLSLIDLRGANTPDEGMAVGAVIYAFVSLVISFFVGGYIAARLANQQTKFSAGLHGVAVFSLVTLTAIFFVSTNAASVIGGVITRAGIGAGSAVGLDAVAKDLRKDIQKMRIVTDLKILEGKAVTQLVLPGTGERGTIEQTLAGIEKKAEQTADQVTQNEKVQADVKETAEDVKDVTAQASWIALLALLLGIASGFLGGTKGLRQRLPVPTEPKPIRRAA